MQQREFLGTVDKECEYIALCKVVNELGPDTHEVWFNPEYLDWSAPEYQNAAKQVKAQSHGRLYLNLQFIRTGLITVHEDPTYPATDNYGVDRAVADTIGRLILMTKESAAV